MLRNAMEPLLQSLQTPLRPPLRAITDLPRGGSTAPTPVGSNLTLDADVLSLDADILTLE